MESLPSQESGVAGSERIGSVSEPTSGWTGFLRRQRWVGFVLPFVVYMGVGAFEPIRPPPKAKPPGQEQFQGHPMGSDADQAAAAGAEAKTAWEAAPSEQPPANKEASPVHPAASEQPELPPEANWAGIAYSAYPFVYALKILLTCIAIGLVWPAYREFPIRVSPLAVLVGIGGLIIWLGFGGLQLERKWLEPIGLGAFLDLGARSGFNPFRVFHDQPLWMLWGFVALRLFGMVVVVTLVEEFFLRGFLMRFVMRADWWEVPVGRVNLAAVLACVIYAVLSHPAELIGATGWFLFITLLAAKTKNIWDCVVAHATTNALLGAYILILWEWRYW